MKYNDVKRVEVKKPTEAHKVPQFEAAMQAPLERAKTSKHSQKI